MTELTNLTKKELFLEAYKKGMCHVSNACKAVNISRDTYYRWKKESKKFANAIAEIDEALVDMAECSLYTNVKNGIQKAIEFFLCNRKKDKYSNTNRTELTGKDGESINVTLNKVIYEDSEKKGEENK